MNFDITGALGLILILFTIAATLAGAAGYYKASAAKSRIEAADADIARWATRYAALEGDLGREKADRQHDVHLEQSKRQLVEESLATANQRISNLADVLRAQDTLKEISEVLMYQGERSKNIERIVIEMARAGGLGID
jgi:hypothetical protein